MIFPRHRRTHSESDLRPAAHSSNATTLPPLEPLTASKVELWKPERLLDARGKLNSALQDPAKQQFESHHGYMNAINEFKRQQQLLTAEKAEMVRQLDSLRYQLNRAKMEKDEMHKEMQRQAEHVARILGNDRAKTPSIDKDRNAEFQFLMQREINASLALKEQLAEAKKRIQIVEAYAKDQVVSIKERDNIIQHQQYVIDQARESEASLRDDIRRRAPSHEHQNGKEDEDGCR
ncbi:hypothetical protein BCR44DRAFT_224915 [Catenaria anguillulae PL171]|uniref:Uncharacterized protein n=1 Tax=Catenaria anguillulae PL171 TaxID=765915 RepID=A0A1Y2HEX0_9FUNG|nr:hypothetical protein BCR44DRAFT_224915 [Catenaria anguillulae PL171]